MSRIYEKSIHQCKAGHRYFITIRYPKNEHKQVEIPKTLFDELDEMQREVWRLNRRESRHVHHIEMMYEDCLPTSFREKSPEEILMQEYEDALLYSAIKQLPMTQRRRLLLHSIEKIPIKQIAYFEGCTPRAVKYSLALAKKNLRKILSENVSL